MKPALLATLLGAFGGAAHSEFGFSRGPKSYNGGRNRHARHGAPKHTTRAKSAKRARSKVRMRSHRGDK